jgi:hypothetical protein
LEAARTVELASIQIDAASRCAWFLKSPALISKTPTGINSKIKDEAVRQMLDHGSLVPTSRIDR